jgi:CDP-2,3-bis-(O-geranylgeranyl)-sn-glycerol synthase
MSLLGLIGDAVWFILPAYVANASPVVLGGGRPIDGGRRLADGRPIFGSGKTIRGFLGGLLAGTAVGGIQAAVSGSVILLFAGFLLSLGALFGDLLGSFIKRRMGLERGKSAPLLDQLGFLLFAVLFALPVRTPSLQIFLILLAITPAVHLAANCLAYIAGLKEKPY